MVLGKETKFVASVEQYAIALRNIRYRIFWAAASTISCILNFQHVKTKLTSICLQAIHWRTGHKTDCQQLCMSSQLSSSRLTNSEYETDIEKGW